MFFGPRRSLSWSLALAARFVLPLSFALPVCFSPPSFADAVSNHAADNAEIKAQANTYSQAFASGDLEKLTSMWSDSAVFMDQSGNVYRGLDGIKKQYASFFARYGGQPIEIDVLRVDFPTDDTAIEEGITHLSNSNAASAAARYVATHVKRDGKWLMQTVTETPYRVENIGDNLKPLSWLQGQWKAEGPRGTLHLKSSWVNKNIISNEFEVNVKDGTKSTQTEYIYWDPRSGGIRSWQFDSNGGTSRSTWELDAGTWTIHSSSVQADGAVARADYIIKALDKDNFVWQSKQRSLSGMPLPDTEQIKVTRDRG